jgi:hypothetical protein
VVEVGHFKLQTVEMFHLVPMAGLRVQSVGLTLAGLVQLVPPPLLLPHALLQVQLKVPEPFVVA